MKKFEITEDRIKLLADNNSWSESKLKEWYPDAFKEVLEYGRWIKDDNTPKWMTFFKNEDERYGLNANSKWYERRGYTNPNDDKDNRYATPQEVQTALINEAKKRGFAEYTTYKSLDGNRVTLEGECFLFNEQKNILCASGSSRDIIFDNGQWATIIQQKEYTMQEIADALKVNVNDLKIKK